jgi:hypothetical protein
MVNVRGTVALSAAVGLMFSATLLAQKKEDKKVDERQKKEIQSVVKIVDDATAGQPGANDFTLTWVHEDFLKAQGNKGFVPFSVSLDSSKVSGGTVALYWRVVAKGGAPAEPAAKGKGDDKDKKPSYAYEDVSFVPVTKDGPAHISRSFTVPAGAYDVFVVAKEPTPDKAPKNAPPPKMSVIKQTVSVPDFWNGELSTSSVLITSRIDPLQAPLTPQQQAERPYALGAIEIQPVFDTKFTKKAELSTFLLIYNPKTDAANKPDVSVEYNFYAKQAGAPEKFFNKTSPQDLNKDTLPPQFDVLAGHQLQTGQAVPLASFPEGDYRLEIKVTDKLANKSLIKEVNFTVTAG